MADKPSERFRFRLADAMEAKKFTQIELARASGVPQPQISTYLLGKRSPSIDVLVQLAAALEVSTDSLLGHTPPHHEGPRNPTKEEIALFIMDGMKVTTERRDVIRSVLIADDAQFLNIRACVQRSQLKEANGR